MSDVVRLTLVSHGMTEAMAAGRFPADEPLIPLGQRQAGAVVDLMPAAAVCGPELRCRQTAEIVGVNADSEPGLADLDCGSWRGMTLEAIPPAELAIWLTEPSEKPHGGESVVELIERVGGWLDTLTDRRVAITHPGVIRAAILVALDAPPKAFWRIDIGPASRTVMHRRGQAWTLRSTGLI